MVAGSGVGSLLTPDADWGCFVKKVLFFFFLSPLVCFADFSSVDSDNLSNAVSILNGLAYFDNALFNYLSQELTRIEGQNATNNSYTATIRQDLQTTLTTVLSLDQNVSRLKSLLVEIEGNVDALTTYGSQINDKLRQLDYNVQDLLANSNSLLEYASNIDSTLSVISGFVGSISSDVSLLKSYASSLPSIDSHVTSIDSNFSNFTNSFNHYTSEVSSDLASIYNSLLVLSSIDQSTASAYTNIVAIHEFLTNGVLRVSLGPSAYTTFNVTDASLRWDNFGTLSTSFNSRMINANLGVSKDQYLNTVLSYLDLISQSALNQRKSGIISALSDRNQEYYLLDLDSQVPPLLSSLSDSFVWTTNYLDTVDRENWRRQLLYMDDTTRFLELIYNELAVMSYSNSVNNADIVDILTNTNIVDEISHDYSDAASAAVDPSTDKIGEWSFDFASFDRYKESFYKPIHRAGQGIGEVPSEISIYLPGLHPAGESAVGLGYVYTDLSQHSGFFEFCRGVCRFLYLGITLLFFWFCFKIVMRIYKYLLDKLSGIAPRN